jgi:hypothetical protein
MNKNRLISGGSGRQSLFSGISYPSGEAGQRTIHPLGGTATIDGAPMAVAEIVVFTKRTPVKSGLQGHY